jgi:CspA family cold shock protein
MAAAGALDALPNIIHEAAKSTLGILALAIITIALLGYGFFRKGSERVKMSMFVLMFFGAVVLAASILRALPPSATKPLDAQIPSTAEPSTEARLPPSRTKAPSVPSTQSIQPPSRTGGADAKATIPADHRTESPAQSRNSVAATEVKVPAPPPSKIPATPSATGAAIVPNGAGLDSKAAGPKTLRHTTGTVKWFNSPKGYGFITDASGQDVFVHFSEITEPGYRSLDDGAEVEFDVLLGPKGAQAHNVRLLHTKK